MFSLRGASLIRRTPDIQRIKTINNSLGGNAYQLRARQHGLYLMAATLTGNAAAVIRVPQGPAAMYRLLRSRQRRGCENPYRAYHSRFRAQCVHCIGNRKYVHSIYIHIRNDNRHYPSALRTKPTCWVRIPRVPVRRSCPK